MLVALLYFTSWLSAVISNPIYPTSYVYRSDGTDHGYRRSFSSGANKEFSKVIVKRNDLPLIVTSYSTFITHPVGSRYGSSVDETGPKNNFYVNGRPVEYIFKDDESSFVENGEVSKYIPYNDNYQPVKHFYVNEEPFKYIVVNDANNDEEYKNDNGETDDGHWDNSDNDSEAPDGYNSEDDVKDEDYDDDTDNFDDNDNYDDGQLYNDDGEDVEDYTSKLYHGDLGEYVRYRPYDDYDKWFRKTYYSDEFNK